MANNQCSRTPDVSKGFTGTEKILMGTGFYGFVLIGIFGIALESVVWALGYAGFAVFGVLVLFGLGICSHCPYIFEEYTDCLFPPWGKVYRKFYRFRSFTLSSTDKILFLTMMIGIVVIPQYWLVKNPWVLGLFWVFCAPTIAGFALYECRRCQHFGCPFNRAASNDPGLNQA